MKLWKTYVYGKLWVCVVSTCFEEVTEGAWSIIGVNAESSSSESPMMQNQPAAVYSKLFKKVFRPINKKPRPESVGNQGDCAFWNAWIHVELFILFTPRRWVLLRKVCRTWSSELESGVFCSKRSSIRQILILPSINSSNWFTTTYSLSLSQKCSISHPFFTAKFISNGLVIEWYI